MLGKESEKMSESGNVSDFFPETFRTARFYKKKKKNTQKKLHQSTESLFLIGMSLELMCFICVTN